MSNRQTFLRDLAQRLKNEGLSPLPVAPTQDPHIYPLRNKKSDKWEIVYEDDGITSKPRFTGKNPSYLDKNGKAYTINHKDYQDEQPSEEELDMWFLPNPNTGIGCLGSKNVIWIDIDKKNFESQEECDRAFNSLLETYPILQKAWLERTHSGGYRIGVKVINPPNFTNFSLTPGGKHIGEALGEGRFTVLAPTIGPSGNPYINLNQPEVLPEVESLEAIGIYPVKKSATNQPSIFGSVSNIVGNSINESAIAIALDKEETPVRPQKLPSLIDVVSTNTRKILDGLDTNKDRSSILTKAANDLFGWVNWLNWNNIQFTGVPEELLQIAGGKLGLDSDRVNRIIASIDTANALPSLKITKDSNGKDGNAECLKKVNKLLGRKSINDHPVFTEEEIVVKQKNNLFWAEKLDLTVRFHPESGDPLGSWVPQALKIAEIIGNRIKFNEMLQCFELDGKEIDLNTCQILIESECGITVAKEKCVDLLTYVAKKLGSYHPVRQYFENVAAKIPPNYDLLQTISSRFFGNLDPLTDIYMRKTLIGAVARAMTPGCKFDTMTILVGEQGAKKSTFWEKLSNVLEDKNLFTDSLQDLANKDELAKLRRFFCLELAEIDFLFSRKDQEQFKRFLSARDDTYRPPYARANETIPRTCFFVGSTNKKELLSDPSGSRRFWVIDVKVNKIDTNLLEKERDILWATAYDAWLKGEEWWLTDEEQELSNKNNLGFQDIDPWQETIEAYLDKHPYTQITTDFVSETILEMPKDKRDKKTSNRIGAIMKSLGFEYVTKRVHSRLVKTWEKKENISFKTEDEVKPETIIVESESMIEAEPEVKPEIETVAEMVDFIKVGIDNQVLNWYPVIPRLQNLDDETKRLVWKSLTSNEQEQVKKLEPVEVGEKLAKTILDAIKMKKDEESLKDIFNIVNQEIEAIEPIQKEILLDCIPSQYHQNLRI